MHNTNKSQANFWVTRDDVSSWEDHYIGQQLVHLPLSSTKWQFQSYWVKYILTLAVKQEGIVGEREAKGKESWGERSF